MPPLTILPDSDVKRILHSLTKSEIEGLQQALRKSLIDYSTAKLSEDEYALTQPERTVIESEKSNGKSTTLFMPSTSAEGLGMKGKVNSFPTKAEFAAISFPSLSLSTSEADISPVVTLPTAGSIGNATPQGAITIMENDGRPIGFINAEELTAFRTALASSLLITRRSKVKTVTVFGAGKQAYVVMSSVPILV